MANRLKKLARLILPEFAIRWWHAFKRESWVIGKWVEVTGNEAVVNHCVISLDDPAIATGLKSRFFFDTYEEETRILLDEYLDPTLPVIELGGSIGVMSCLINRRLKAPEHHLVVEANTDLLTILTTNRDRNNCQFAIINRALAYGVQDVVFYQHRKFVGGSVQRETDRSVIVPATTLASLVTQHNLPTPITLVCDIEGGEIDLVMHEIDLLADHVAMLFFDTHPYIVGEARVLEMIQSLTDAGFVVLKTLNWEYALVNRKLIP